MIKKLGVFALVLALVLGGLVPASVAAEKEPPSGNGQVTQAELAHMLVNLLALARFLPANPSDQECVAILLQNQISPAEGWALDAVVTKGDLAVVLVKCLKANGEEIDFDTNDSKAAIAYLKEQGIPIDTIGEGVAAVNPLPNPVAPYVFSTTTDPLKKQHHFGEPDEQEYGADAELPFVNRPAVAGEEEIAAVVVAPPAPHKGGGGPTKFKP